MLKITVNWLNLYMKNIWRNTYVKGLETEGQNHKEIQTRIQTELPLFKSWEDPVSLWDTLKLVVQKWLHLTSEKEKKPNQPPILSHTHLTLWQGTELNLSWHQYQT